MKKLFLLTATAFSVMAGANAQEGGAKSLVFKDFGGQEYKPANFEYRNFVKQRNATNAAQKSTAAGVNRWYSVFDVADSYLGGTLPNNDFVFPIGWDSLLKQRYNTGMGAVNWIAVASFVDPINSQGFNDPINVNNTLIKVNAWNSYTIDSIFFPGAYVSSPTGLPGTIDTFYLSVAAVPFNDASITAATDADVTAYTGVTANGNVLKYQRLGATDSFNRQLGNAVSVKWKVPIVDTMRKPKNTDGTYITRNYIYKLPTPLTVPAGQGVAMSFAFKGGEPWVNGDSVQQHHYFMPLAGQGANGAIMPYFYYDYTDRSMSYLMHYEAIGGFNSAIGLELANTKDFSREFIDMAVKINCATCASIGTWTGINSVPSLQTAKVYPNPAASVMNIDITLAGNVKTVVSIANTVGQVIETKDMGVISKGTATFNVANLANGIYFYTIEADGERTTKRFVVAH